MPTSPNAPRPAENWIIVDAEPQRQRLIDQVLLPSDYQSHTALGILAAGQAYFNDHPDEENVTLFYPHPLLPRPEDTEPFYSCLSIAGHAFKYSHSIDEISEAGRLVLVTGPLPSPGEIVANPGLVPAIEKLASYTVLRSPNGLGYIGLSRVAVGSSIRLGFANPFDGSHLEAEFDLTPLKEKFEFPPSIPYKPSEEPHSNPVPVTIQRDRPPQAL